LIADTGCFSSLRRETNSKAEACGFERVDTRR
jgi:hypothetical protein